MYVAQSIVFAIGISIFVTIFGLNFSDELLRIMGSSDQSIILTREYLDIIFYGAIIVLVQLSLNGTLNAQGDTKSYRNVLIFTFFLNIFLNPLFIFGYGFIPAFGIAGLAIATLISQFIGLIYLLFLCSKSVSEEGHLLLRFGQFLPSYLSQNFLYILLFVFQLSHSYKSKRSVWKSTDVWFRFYDFSWYFYLFNL